MKIKLKKRKLIDYLAYILGLSVCTNIIGLQVSYYTFIELSLLLGFLSFLYLCILGRMKLISLFCRKSIILYAVIITFLSILTTFIYVDSSFKLTPLKNLVLFMLLVFLYCDVLMLADKYELICKGIYNGVAINFLFSFFQLLCFVNDIDFSLSKWFPQRFFQLNTYQYRAQGLFLETSHFAIFLVISLMVISFCLDTKTKILFWLFAIFLIGISFSGNILFVIAGFILSYYNKEKILCIKRRTIISFFIYMLMFAILIINIIGFKRNVYRLDIFSKFRKAISDLNIFDKNNVSNVIRLKSIMLSLKIVPHYPFGAGYGMASKILVKSFSTEIVDTFCYLITVVIETGIEGIFAYLYILYDVGIRLIKKKGELVTMGMSVIMIYIVQTVNGIHWMPLFIITIALCCVRYNDYV